MSQPIVHHRKSIRLQEYDYGQAGAYYITICTYDKKCIFGTITDGQMLLSEFGQIMEDCWKTIPKHFDFVLLDVYSIMPNHLHGILIIVGRRMRRPY